MKRFLTTIKQLIEYNIKIIFGNKFLYFMLGALVFFGITVSVNMLGNDEITAGTAYSMLMMPCILLVFYPMCFGIQNDQDAKIIEIIFGIPNYSYKIWLFRLLISYIICFLITIVLATITWWVIVDVSVLTLTFQSMVPALFIGTLSFMLSTIIKNGNGTSVVIIIIGLILTFVQDFIGTSPWNIYLNPFNLPTNMNVQIFYEIVFNNRLIMVIASIIFILAGLNKTRDREQFI